MYLMARYRGHWLGLLVLVSEVCYGKWAAVKSEPSFVRRESQRHGLRELAETSLFPCGRRRHSHFPNSISMQ